MSLDCVLDYQDDRKKKILKRVQDDKIKNGLLYNFKTVMGDC